MRIQEYQTKQFFKQYSIPVLDSCVVESSEEVKEALKKVGGNLWAVKAQVLAGGRGKAGGVKITKSPEEAEATAKALLGKKLVTHQTGPEGEIVRKLLIEKGCEIEKEYYLSLLVDTETSRIIFMVSQAGGMDIEETAQTNPEKIYKISIHPSFGFQPYQSWSLAQALNISKKAEVMKLHSLFQQLYRLFVEKDGSLLEINPLIKTSQGEFIALDGKMSFDENALYRHSDLMALSQAELKPDYEREAARQGLALIKLEGNIGCMVNGAGLAMATMDMIKLHGGSPANFLDVGGGAEQEKVVKAFEIILSFPQVQAVLVNIFGGIMKCDIIASGLVQAVKQVGLKVPVVVRLEGTRSAEGLKLLRDSGLSLIPSESLDEAARKVVEVAGVHSGQ
ncbi:MAG: ADP-forming succinate--CoA ligase subunit beta [Bdellovibrionales bacterium]|nr:ADP-forming succinate--CoA ligase subunit beta [Bdellovibrionales bacterium]